MYNKREKKASVPQLLKIVRSFDRTNTKTAAIGGHGDDTSFEQAFSNLAHAYLRDSAPKLLDHEIGFQLLDRNRENTKAVGVFAFKVGSNWMYAPVFFLNGDLKGHELLYLKNQDMFVPLKENWINYLLNRKPSILGSGIQRNLTPLGQRQPDFTQLTRSPSKFGSAQPTLKEMMASVMPTFARTATMNTKEAFEQLGKSLHLGTFLKQARLETVEMLVKLCQHAPQVAEALDEFHGLNIVKEAIAEIKERDRLSKISSVLTKKAEKPEAQGTLQVITHDLTVQKGLPPEYTEEDQEKLLRDGVLIKDERDRDAVSIPYNIQVQQKFFNPTESGLYEVLVKPGEIERCYIAVHPMGPSKRADFATVVRVEGKPDWLNTRPDHIFCLAHVEGDEFDSWYNALPDANSVGKDARYMVLNKKGDTSVPFRVLKEYGENAYGTTTYEVHMEDHSKFPPRGSIGPCCYSDPLNYDKYRDGVRVHLNGKKGSGLRSSMGDIFVPESFKLLKVSKGEDDGDEDGQDTCGCGESDPPALQPGNLLDVQSVLMNKLGSLEVRHNGSDVWINNEQFTTKSALISLVKQHGLREAAAREILSKAAAQRKFACHVKYADPYGGPMMIHGAPSAPADPGPVMGGESIMGTNIPTQLGIDVGVPVPGMSAAQTDRSVYNPNTQFDQKAVQQVLDAAQSGQREVFDTAMIGTMLRAVRDDGLVDRYMGDLTKGLDKIGRILFMFYWHGDRFADRYGKSDMPELEDSLRNAFEMLGDVILFLKQKTIEPYPEESSQDVDLNAPANV